MKIEDTLGHKLNTLRLSKKMSLQAVATKVCFSKSYLWEIENVLHSRPSAELIYRLSRLFKVNMEYFMNDNIPNRDNIK